MRTLRVGLLAVVASVSLASSVRAAAIYEYVFDRPSYTVSPGGVAELSVFLQETVTGADVSRLATDGLIGAGVRVQFDVAPAPAMPAQVLSAADIAANSAAFDGTSLLIKELASGSSAGLSEAVDLTSPAVTGTLIAPGTYRIPLGTFRFTAGSVPGQTTNLLATRFSPGSTETVTGSGLGLDSLTASGSATLTVVPIPEPGSMAVLGTGVIGLAAWGRGRRSPARVP
jgi:hypothetical protein